jgi:Family of unknown function (DUF6400)
MDSTVPEGSKPLASNPAEVVMAFDLATHEARRRIAVLDAMGAHWNPVVVLANEEAARELLYSGLDEHTQRIYDDLVAAGVIPPVRTAHS